DSQARALASQVKRRLGRTEEGLEDFDRAVAADRRHVWKLSLGYGREPNEALYERELRALDAVVARRPEWGTARIARGLARAFVGEKKEMAPIAAEILKGVALGPGYAWGRLWLGEVYRW